MHEQLVRTRALPAAERFFELAARSREDDLTALLTLLPDPGADDFGPHLDALWRFPPDPRLAEALRRGLETQDDLAHPRWRSTWRRVLPLLARVGDPRVAAWLPGLVRAQRGGTAASRRWLVGEVRALCGALPEARESGVAPFVAREAPPLSSLTAEERMVIADGLSEQGDPLGEFLVLQHLPRLLSVERKREAQLQRVYSRRWLGALSRAVRPDGLRFEKGVVVACRLSGARAAELTNHPAWATVRSLELRATSGPVDARLEAFLLAPAMAALTELRGVPLALAYALLERRVPFQLELLALQGYGAFDAELLSWSAAFRSVRTLIVNGQAQAMR
jgi:hypothetical protein